MHCRPLYIYITVTIKRVYIGLGRILHLSLFLLPLLKVLSHFAFLEHYLLLELVFLYDKKFIILNPNHLPNFLLSDFFFLFFFPPILQLISHEKSINASLASMAIYIDR